MNTIKGIDLNLNQQLNLIQCLSEFYSDIPFKAEKQNNLKYYFNNSWYSYTDGIILYSMIRKFNPSKIIEIGSGFSSCVMLDTKNLFFENNINLTFIDPNTDRLMSLLASNENVYIHKKKIQDIDLDIFKNLNANDILFVDSSHIVNFEGDVNFILFEILPLLKSGVIIHFHDIFYPFEYPKSWIIRNLNEAYFLKCFLMYNSNFKIILWSDFLHKNHSKYFTDMPLCYKNTGGNLWIVKK